MDLRPYQFDLKQDANSRWAQGFKNVLLVLPTGGGKTVVFSSVIKDHKGACCAVAHRQELVGQISLALAREGIKHKIIAPDPIIRHIISLQRIELGRDFYDPQSQVAVAGVKTLTSTRRMKGLQHWLAQVTLWVMDEAHHVLIKNHWGKAVELFPNARGLGVTATPCRADGKGIGTISDGVFDCMCVGPTMRDLINDGFLCDYRIFAPPNDLDLSTVKVDATGEYNRIETKKAIHRSRVVGDVVDHYIKIAKGKLGVTFAQDVETATDIANKFNAAGITAVALSAKTDARTRVEAVRRFAKREILQLVNCDLFGEGFDLPAIEVVSFARPTASYGLYCQQFGRALRPLEGKPHAIIIDHVGNVERHRLPDAPRDWTLGRTTSRRKRHSGEDAIPVQTCPECTAVYELIHHSCPFCGNIPTPVSRSGPTFVNGDLTEIDPEKLAEMRGEVDRIDGEARIPQNLPAHAQAALRKRWRRRQDVQAVLRQSIAWWGGYFRALGADDKEIYKRFYFRFGVDMMTAQTYGEKDAEELVNTINYHMGELVTNGN